MRYQCKGMHLLVSVVYFIQQLSIITGSCGGTLSGTNGTISTPEYPHPYSSNMQCLWQINVTTGSSVRLQLWFVSFDIAGVMHDCSKGDSLELLVGCRPLSLGRFCGKSKLPVFYSLDNCITIRFNSRAHSSGHGFKAYYSTKPAKSAVSNIHRGCGISVFENSHSGNIFTPMWPQPYPQYVDCLWRVTIQENLSVKLFFTDFDLDSGQCSKSDFLDVRAGSSGLTLSTSILKVQNSCTRNLPFEMKISYSNIYIKFESRGVERRRGFMAGFVTYAVENEKNFDAKVLIMLAIIFGIFIFLGLKAYIKTLLQNRGRKCDEEKTSFIQKSRNNVQKFMSSSRFLHNYFTQRRSRGVTTEGQQESKYDSTQVPQSQSQFQLLRIPQSTTDPDLLSFGQHVDDTCQDSRPASSVSTRTLAWVQNPSPEKLGPDSDDDGEVETQIEDRGQNQDI